MSVQSEITRIANNVSESSEALEEFGVSAANSDELAGAIRAIPRAEVVQVAGDSTTAVMSQAAVTAELSQLSNEKVDKLIVPDYWQEYVNSKISDIKANQDKGGKDAFNFVVIADMHYPSNLGNNSPVLAEYICQACDIPYILLLGDVRTRGLRNTKDEVLAEFDELETILAPIRHRTLQTQGNHDAGYGKGDYDGDGDQDNYAYELSHAEVFNRIYRKSGMVGECHYDASGSGYWIDDVSNRVRYIVLNTQNTSEEKNADGTSKYPSMWLFRFGQSQFDLTINALNSVPADDWAVVVAGHCPITQEIGDREVMQGVLAAYAGKTTFAGEYAGTGEAGAGYTNLAEPLPDNTTDTTKWVNGYRYSSSGGPSAQSGTTISNTIPCKKGDVIRIKGVTLRENTDRINLFHSGTEHGARGYFNVGISSTAGVGVTYDGLVEGVYKFTISADGDYEVTGFRFAMPTPEDASEVIITVNQEIVEGGKPPYDSVSVDADFTQAKGELVGYFAGHTHADTNSSPGGIPVITTRCDAKQENTDALKAERIAGTVTEQSFDVFTVDKANGKIYATKIGAGSDREISY